jgi:large subunit ribosomal protein L11
MHFTYTTLPKVNWQEEKMADNKKITAKVKLQLPAGKATTQPPVGSSLGPYGINLGLFTKDFNEKTADKAGLIIPVIVSIYADRSFTFELKLHQQLYLLRKLVELKVVHLILLRTKWQLLQKLKLKKLQKQRCLT